MVEFRPGSRLIPDRDYPAAWTVRIDGTDQSYVDLDDPRRLEFDYMQRIGDVVDLIAPPRQPVRTVHVGGGALTLPRYIAATRPRSSQVVFEPDVELTAVVREHLPLPRRSGIRVRPLDGRAGIAELRDGYADLVVVDAFVGAQVPALLTTIEFFTDVQRILSPGGIVVVNVTDRSRLAYSRRVVTGLSAVFPRVLLAAEPATLKGRRFGNLVLVASSAALPLEPLTRKAAGSVFAYRVLSGSALKRWSGASTAYRDADAEPSPDPLRSRARFG